MSFKRNNMDDDDNDNDNDAPFVKRQRFDDDFRGPGRGRGRDFRGRGGRGDRGGRGRDFRGRGGFNRGDDDSDYRGRGGFLGGRGRGRGRDRGGGRGRGRGGGGFDRFERESIIKVGQVAPTFENVMNDNSEPTSLEQYQGKYVVLFIYFRDGTYGCSEEQKAFRDAKNDFDKLNAVVIGVSQDNVSSHQKAIEELHLNYTLLADTDTSITRDYGAIDNGHVTRCTFLISPEGKIAAVWSKIFGFDKHPKEVARKLEEISAGKSGDDESKNENEESGGENENENEEDDDVNEDDNEANDDDNADDDE